MRLEELVEAFRSGKKAEHKGPGYLLMVQNVTEVNVCSLAYKSNGRLTNILMRKDGNYFVWDCAGGVPLSIDNRMFALQEKIISLLGMHRTISPTMAKCSGDWHALATEMQSTVRPVNPITIDSLWGEL